MYLDALSNLKQGEKTVADRKGLGDNFDTFLTLLTTQLKNQNPLNPMDTNQFTQQLVQFSSVEQSIKANANLESLIKLSAASAATSAVSFIGKTVEVPNSAATFDGTKATWKFDSAGAAQKAKFTLRDDAGKVVHTFEKDIVSGKNEFVWDGKDGDDKTVPKGKYSLTIEASDSEGKAVQTKLTAFGLVDTVEFEGNDPLLVIGGKKIPLSTVRSVGQG